VTGGAGGALLLLQTLTNLNMAPQREGIPPGWRLASVKGVPSPTYRVTAAHTLRIAATGQAATLTYRLRPALRPPPSTRAGALNWRWRSETPLRAADLRRRAADDAPIRVVITFQDGRVLTYTWGNRESRGESFASWSGGNRMVIVLERADDADGSWHVERRDPFSDYRRLWNNAPKPIVSIGVNADTDGLKVRASAEIGDMTWTGP
jgi:hypothetical protein